VFFTVLNSPQLHLYSGLSFSISFFSYNPYFGVIFANEQLTTFKSAIFFVAIEI
jgi:hypothetical protein